MKNRRTGKHKGNKNFESFRYDKFISTEDNMSIKQHEQFIKQLADEYDDAVNEINIIVAEIRSRVQLTNPSDLLNYLFSMNMICSLNKEIESDFSADLNAQLHSVEYIQSVLVSTPNHYIPCQNRTEQEEKSFGEILSLTTELYNKIFRFYLIWSAKAKTTHTLADDELNYAMIAQTMFLVRGDQYQIFRLETLSALLLPHMDELQEIYGVDAKNILDGLKVLEHNLTNGRLDAIETLHDLFEKHHEDLETASDEFKEKASEKINHFLGIDLHNVNKYSGWPVQLISDLSLDINSDTSFYDHDAFSGWPTWNLPIKRKPFIRINGQSYCFDYHTLFDNFYRSLQNAVFSYGEKYKEWWNKTQAETSEELVGNIFEKILPECIVYRGNHYKIEKNSVENDLIIAYKDVLFIVEVKAGSFTYTPAFFDLKAHKESLKSLIQKAEKQCIRTRDYILSYSEAKFYSDDALEQYSFSIYKDSYSQIYMLDVTVDTFNEIASAVEKIQIAKAKEDIISLSIEDLWVYRDYFDNPAQFIHFIKQRTLATRADGIYTFDELDHLGLYIEYNMYSLQAQNIGHGTIVNFTGYRDDLDRYYYRQHLGWPSKKPAQEIPDTILRIIDNCIYNSSIEKPLRFTNFLLDLSPDSKQSLSDSINELASHQIEAGHMFLGAGFGDAPYILMIRVPGINYGDFDTKNYVETNLVKSERKQCYFIEITLGNQNEIVDINASLFERDNIEPERIDILKEHGDELLKTKFKRHFISKVKIGRNEPCLCGSGKKYKNCCGKLR